MREEECEMAWPTSLMALALANRLQPVEEYRKICFESIRQKIFEYFSVTLVFVFMAQLEVDLPFATGR